MFGGDHIGAIRNGDIVCGEAFFSGFPVADDQGFYCAQLDGEEGAVVVGDGAEEVVGGWGAGQEGVFELKYNLNSMYTICHAMQGSFMEAKQVRITYYI